MAKKVDNKQVNKDLSKVETSMTSILEKNRAKFDNCTSVKQLVAALEDVFNENNFNTEASRRLVLNVSKNRYYPEALMTIYNSILAGSKLSVDQK